MTELGRDKSMEGPRVTSELLVTERGNRRYQGEGIRIAIVTTNLAVAGAEVQVVLLAQRLKRRGWEPVVVSVMSPSAFSRELEVERIPLVSLGVGRMISAPSVILKLARFLNDFRPHIVHAHMFHANFLVRLVRPLAPVPVVICTAHSTYETSSKTTRPREVTWREWAYRLTDPLCDITTQVGRAGLARYVRVRAVPRNKICLVPNGVDTECFRPDLGARVRGRAGLGLNDEFVWLSVGRFDPAKDHWTMLQAFARLRRAETVLLLVGEGRLSAEMKRLASDLGIADRVRFAGFRPDVPDLMNAADAYVMSSRWEGLPMVLLEAQACCLPVVATRVGGVDEVVQDRETGLLVSALDPAALASAMEQVITIPEEERRIMGEAGRLWIEDRFSLNRVVNQWEALYRELIKNSGGKPSRTAFRYGNEG